MSIATAKKDLPPPPSKSTVQPSKDDAKLQPLPNRAGEQEFKLDMTPQFVSFVCTADEKPVYCDVQLKNMTAEKHSFKVKCTPAEIFRVQPPMGFVKANETVNIRVWFQNKAIPEGGKQHYFAVYHVKMSGWQGPQQNSMNFDKVARRASGPRRSNRTGSVVCLLSSMRRRARRGGGGSIFYIDK